MTYLADILDRRFQELGTGPAKTDRAARLREDRATYTKIVNATMVLTHARALAWSRELFEAEAEAGSFADQLVEAARRDRPSITMSEFCDSIVAEGGAVGGERVADLLVALDGLTQAIVCVEYRDVPRSGWAAKYEGLGKLLGEAVARGLTFAMFQPFGTDPPLPPRTRSGKAQTPSYATAMYMRQVQEKCRSAHRTFQQYASRKLQEETEVSPADPRALRDRLRLYERKGAAYLGSGLQANLFYVEWLAETSGIEVRHKRVFQWVTTPKRDLLIYRGPGTLEPEAVRDTFYPVPHFHALDEQHRLPDPGPKVYRLLEKDSPGRMELPFNYDVWEAWTEDDG